MTTLLLSHPACLEHDTGLWPSRAGRPLARHRVRARRPSASIIWRASRRRSPILPSSSACIPRPMSRSSAPRSRSTTIIGSTPTPSFRREAGEAALRATGAAVHAVDQVMAGEANNAFCAVRPPGHHAEPSRAMGFCLFNNVAVAALHARAAHGAERVAVVDFDVHHGNGTQDAFWSDKDLFYGSTHQMPLFPGTGALERDRRRQYLQRAAQARRRRRRLPRGFRDAHPAGARRFRARLAADLGRLRRPSSTTRLAQLRLVEADFAWVTEQAARGGCQAYAAAGSSRRSRAATTSMPWPARPPSTSQTLMGA